MNRLENARKAEEALKILEESWAYYAPEAKDKTSGDDRKVDYLPYDIAA